LISMIGKIFKVHGDLSKLIRYCRKLKNGTVFKRLGLLLEMDAPEEKKAIKVCRDSLSQAYSKLSPSLNCSKIITKWKLFSELSFNSLYTGLVAAIFVGAKGYPNP